jgi:hypothetical protein
MGSKLSLTDRLCEVRSASLVDDFEDKVIQPASIAATEAVVMNNFVTGAPEGVSFVFFVDIYIPFLMLVNAMTARS